MLGRWLGRLWCALGWHDWRRVHCIFLSEGRVCGRPGCSARELSSEDRHALAAAKYDALGRGDAGAADLAAPTVVEDTG